MNLARLCWATLLLLVVLYTEWVVARHGWNFAVPFYGAIGRGDWQGQFNADFHAMLILSAWWTGWRSGWGVRGCLRALLALGLGAPFLCAYLLVLSFQRGATPARILLGVHEGKTT